LLALYWSFSSGVGVNLYNPPANGKQEPIPEEMSQTLQTNKKQGTWIKYAPLTVLSQRKLTLTAKNTFLCHKIIGAPKKLKTGRVPYG
jgi:hypothetical protein